MSFLTEWITNIILFVLLATVVDMLLPSSIMKKYTKIVVGLLLITIILTPLFQFLTSDFEEVIANMPLQNQTEEARVENLIEMKKKEIQATQDAYILKQMAVQMKEEAQAVLGQDAGWMIGHVELEADHLTSFPEGLSKILVYLSTEAERDEGVAPIQEVSITTTAPIKKASNAWGELSATLAGVWSVEAERIFIFEEGRIEKRHEL
ncbi:stage III sporulation protein AF [Bacillus sp. 2205SS5-2]|uniref:stage III sporulation protein AF n=1 Tax=Bacillus sp. 2205SS5-2 TaxID=3109031 RepID=UPI003007BAFA